MSWARTGSRVSVQNNLDTSVNHMKIPRIPFLVRAHSARGCFEICETRLLSHRSAQGSDHGSLQKVSRENEQSAKWI